MCGHRVVIPANLQPQVLTEIHDGHMGVVRMKALARMHVWWPCIDKHIEGHAYRCIPCQQNSREPVKAPWETPRKPWSQFHIDFVGPFGWPIVLDVTSKWPEVIKMNSNTTTKHTITVLRTLFSRLGLPKSNGEAEHFVQTFKNAIRRVKHSGIDKALRRFY